jgi:hypothetical protein
MNSIEVAATSILEAELRDGLAQTEIQYELQTTICFGDLIWDADFTMAELLAPDNAVILDSRENMRRIVLQRIRGEIRYWLTMDRTPGAYSADSELGKVGSLDDAIVLCMEFLGGASDVLSLRTPRIVGGAKRGEQAR